MTPRDSGTTKRQLLQAGHDEVYLRGFQSATLDDILQRAGVSKGAFFHHFASKAEFGYALVDEILAEMIAAQWVSPLRDSPDVLETIAVEFERGIEVLGGQRPILGCPLNNLAQEMSPLDDEFRRRTSAVFDLWRATFRKALERAQTEGAVRASIDAGDAAHTLVAQIEGTLSLARNSQDPDTLATGARGLRRYLESLRVA